MEELLTRYTSAELISIIVTLALAIKGVASFWDWGKEKFLSAYTNLKTKEEKEEKIEERFANDKKMIEDLFSAQEAFQQQLLEIQKTLTILINSDKDDIKSWITEKHHFFCYTLKWIDDYNLDCIEKRYEHYAEEGGNSFIEGFMEDLRSLPKQPYKRNNERRKNKT